MEEIIQAIKRTDIDVSGETDNEILKSLSGYLNSKFESERDDYEKVSSYDIPSPQLQENGMWKIPGIPTEFKTDGLARKAVRRFTDYQTQDEACKLLHGVSYEEYIHGEENGKNIIKEIQSSNGEGEDPTGDNTRDSLPDRKPEANPETPADFN